MYLVISTWEAMPGHEDEFDRLGPQMAAVLRRQPGVELVEAIDAGNNRRIAVHGYRDEATYRGLVDNPNSEFAKAAADHRLEEVARWLGSERGETMPHA